MNKKLIAAIAATTMAGAIGFASVASAAAEFHWYGSLRAGLVSGDDDLANSDSRLDLGATGKDGSVGGQGLYSRIGIKAKTDFGNGQSAGLRLERGVGDTLSVRHTNVWIGGGWGKLTFGQQDNSYYEARHWDQTVYMGGQIAFTDGGSRIEGIRYDSNFGGPFSFSIMAEGNDDGNIRDERKLTAASPNYMAAVDAMTERVESDNYADSSGFTRGVAFTSGQDVVVSDEMGTAIAGSRATTGTAAVILPATPGTSYLRMAKDGDNPDFVFELTGDVASVGAKEVGESAIAATTVAVAAQGTAQVNPESRVKSENGVDAWVIKAAYDAGPVTISIAHRSAENDYRVADYIDNAGVKTKDVLQTTYDNTVIGVNGVAGPVDWYLAYQTASANVEKGGALFTEAVTDADVYVAAEAGRAFGDVDSIGGFVSLNLGERDKIYAQYVSHSIDDATNPAGTRTRGRTPTELVLGYSHIFVPGVTFIGEYLSIDRDYDSNAPGDNPTLLALTLKVDF